jgi:hypothetical protein
VRPMDVSAITLMVVAPTVFAIAVIASGASRANQPKRYSKTKNANIVDQEMNTILIPTRAVL